MRRRKFLRRMLPGLALSSTIGMRKPTSAQAMVPGEIITNFIHGSTVTVEFPENTNLIRHTGVGTVIDLRVGSECWLHVAVPTSLTVNGSNLMLTDVRVRFCTASDETIVDRIDVYDGEVLIQTQADLALARGQDFAFQIDPPRLMLFGLGISLHVVTGIGPGPHELTFYGAGGTFQEA